jgi:glutathione S-transferase
MLKILGRIPSINVRKVLWTAGELGLEYDREDWGGPTRSVNEPEFAALNPNRQIPVLIHDRFVLWESQAIMRYLAALAGDTPLYPAQARERALVDQWLDWNGTEFNPAWEYAFQALVRRKPGYVEEERIALSIAASNRQIALLDAHLAEGRAHMTGDAFTLADIAVALGIHRWTLTPMGERPRAENVARYMQRLAGRPEYSRWCAPDTP